MRTLLLLLILFCSTTPALAQTPDMTTFEQIPVLENGRIKPLGNFARHKLETLSGKTTWQDKSAASWLAETLFNPSEAIMQKIIRIDSEALKRRLDLPLDQDTYTLAELRPGLQATMDETVALAQTDQENLTTEQKNLMRLHDNVLEFSKLLRSFSLILPLNITLPEKYGIDKTPLTFMDIRSIEQRVQKDVQAIIKRKGEDIQNYDDTETAIAQLGFQLMQIRSAGQGNNAFLMIPATWNKDWYSPWQILENGQGSPETAAYLEIWQDIATAYRTNNLKQWDIATNKALETVQTLRPEQITQARLKTELLYQKIKPYHAAMILYALSITLLIFCFPRASGDLLPQKSLAPHLRGGVILGITGTLAALGLLAHIGGIAARIYILERPPVGTLYESILFVSALSAAAGIISTWKTKTPLPLLAGQIAALGLLAIAPVLLQDKDSLELLVAVLNTNFWLTTHVLCITAGYAVCIFTAILAHAYLIKNSQNWLSLIHKLSLIALFLTAFGTVLGGIWADQSWGRFWGWDPKENGALLIVLWLIWAQHGRISQKFRSLEYTATLAALNIIVALSWFGVNLLGVGLHSYGFTSGLATGLAAFCTLEIVIIAALYITARKRQKT